MAQYTQSEAFDLFRKHAWGIALDRAAREGLDLLVAFLLESGANPNGPRNKGNPIYDAVLWGQANAARLLLQHRANVQLDRALLVGASSPEMLRLFLDEFELKCSTVTLHSAVQDRLTALVERLCRHGVPDGPDSKTGRWAIHKAQNKETLKLLIQHADSDVEARDNAGCTPFLYYVARNRLDLAVTIVRDHFAYTRALDDAGRSAVFYAQTPGMLRFLLDDLGLQASWMGSQMETALHSPFSKISECCKRLLEHIDVNARDSAGRTPLHCLAASGATPDAIRVLLDARADVSAIAFDGRNVLHFAAAAFDDSKIGQGQATDLAAIFDAPPVRFAALSVFLMRNHAAILDVLLQAGVDVNAEDERGRTPLHYTTSFRGAEVFLEGKVRVALDELDNDGNLAPIVVETPTWRNQVFDSFLSDLRSSMRADSSLEPMLNAVLRAGINRDRVREAAGQRPAILRRLNGIEDRANGLAELLANAAEMLSQFATLLF